MNTEGVRHAQRGPARNKTGASGVPARAQATQAQATIDASTRMSRLGSQVAGLGAVLDANLVQRRTAELAAGAASSARLARVKQAAAVIERQAGPMVDAAPAFRAGGTVLPHQLKAGIERLSGMTMDHVGVHFNSAQPAQLGALAYAQGKDIHVARGQEGHLAHEAWHVVQQAQGRVRPTMQMRGDVPVNDDAGLEREADVMGARALSAASVLADATPGPDPTTAPRALQRMTAGTTASDDVLQMLPLRVPVPENPNKEALNAYFNNILGPELAEAERDDRAPVSQYASWWKHDVLVSGKRVERLRTGDNDELLARAVRYLAELLIWPAPTLELIPGALEHLPEPEHGPLDNGSWGEPEELLLTGKKQALLHGTHQQRLEAIDQIRGKDKVYHPGQGAILRQFIMEERKAIMGLVSAAIGSDAIFSLERGGSMISDLIVRLADVAQGRELQAFKVPKVMGENLHGKKEIEDKPQQRKNFKDRIVEFVETMKQHDRQIVISIAETAVGGSSVNELLGDLKRLDAQFQKSKVNVQFRVLVARETIKNVNYEGEGRLKLRDPAENPQQRPNATNPSKSPGISFPGKLDDTSSARPPEVGVPSSRVEMYVSQLRYLIGEDVNYQLTDRDEGHPVIVFDESDNTLRGLSISPGGPTDSARNIIIDLVAGAYDSVLDQALGEQR